MRDEKWENIGSYPHMNLKKSRQVVKTNINETIDRCNDFIVNFVI